MDQAQRTVLQNNHMDLAQDIVVTEDFLGICFQQKLFDTQLIEIIREQTGSKTKTYKMLELLPTRGPDAFNKFLKIIDPDYQWLASKLRADLEQEVCKVPKKDATTSSTTQHHQTNGTDRSQKDVEMVSVATQKTQLSLVTPSNTLPTRSVSLTEPPSQKDLVDHGTNGYHLNGYQVVKRKIGNFMTQQFSLSRKLCQSDKQAIENFITEQIRDVQKQCYQKVTEVRDHRRLNDDIQKWLHDTHRKLERHMGHINPCDTIDGTFVDSKSSIQDIDKCLLHLTEKIHKLEHEVKKCHSLFGDNSDHNFSLAYQVESVLAEKKKLKREIKKLQHENEQMIHENYELSSGQQRLKQESSYKTVELEVKDRQIKNLQSEKHELKKEIDRLQRLHNQHLEKEKTLLNLQQMVAALKDQNNELADETANLRIKMQDEIKRNSPRRSQSIPKTSKVNYTKYKSPTRKKSMRP